MRFQWHPQLHRELGKERLCFWRLGFSPTYDRELVKTGLQELFEQSDVHSYALYEMIGIHDLMLRLWLPTSMTQAEFDGELRNVLGGHGLALRDSFAVDETIAHWVWTTDEGAIRPVDDAVLTQGLPDDVVAEINDGRLTKEDQKRYKTLNVIAPSSHGAGIKFFIVITTSGNPANMVDPQEALRKQIVHRLRKAKSIKEKSLYSGSGLGQFLVMGKVATSQFTRIFSELVDPINQLGLSHNFRARTYTHVCTTGVVDFVDRLPPWRDVVRDSDIRPVEEYLREEEGQTLELKGSAFVNVESWMKSRKAKFDEEILRTGVLKTIVGMLNAGGGTIVVGVLETRAPFLKATTGDGALAECPVFEDRRILFGLESDYRVSGGTKDWDVFLQRLWRKIRDLIDPTPIAWVTIEPAELMGKPLAVISVREPDSRWFYMEREKADPVFYVRQHNETSPLTGAIADEYKRAKGRF